MHKEGFYHRPLTVIRPIDIENFLKGMRRDGRSDSYISKAGKKTPHIGRFWSGCAAMLGGISSPVSAADINIIPIPVKTQVQKGEFVSSQAV